MNYCSWACQVEEAKKAGGTVHCPNGLPIGTIKYDNSMWEHEHGDHPDYKFPVEAVYCGPAETAPKWVSGDGVETPMTEEDILCLRHEDHALIYSDGGIALTVFECCYATWSLRSGLLMGGSLWKPKEWKLTQESVDKIRVVYPAKEW